MISLANVTSCGFLPWLVYELSGMRLQRLFTCLLTGYLDYIYYHWRYSVCLAGSNNEDGYGHGVH